MSLTPFLMKLLTSKLQLALPLYVIGFDPHTTTGFIVNYIFQVLAAGFSCFIYSLFECLVIIFLGSTATQIEVLRTKVRQFEQSILMKENNRTLKRKFSEIIDYHNELLEFARKVEKLLSCELLISH